MFIYSLVTMSAVPRDSKTTRKAQSLQPLIAQPAKIGQKKGKGIPKGDIVYVSPCR